MTSSREVFTNDVVKINFGNEKFLLWSQMCWSSKSIALPIKDYTDWIKQSCLVETKGITIEKVIAMLGLDVKPKEYDIYCPDVGDLMHENFRKLVKHIYERFGILPFMIFLGRSYP